MMTAAPSTAPQRRITAIPVSRSFQTTMAVMPKACRRVAAYARVSTKSDEQNNSYEAQIAFYTDYIQSHENWTLVEVYTDKESGTNTKRREGFNRMISDALAGRIDLIITKSVSRFGRNTVDTLVSIRKLKEKNVEVYFEEQNIYSLDNKGEVMLTIMSSLAQDESRNISENVRWGQHKRFAAGKVTIQYGHFLGYRKGADGQPEIDEEQAAIVRRIYRDFLSGASPYTIAKALTEENIPTPGGGKKWLPSVILSILTNEKYKGDALLQKTFTVDFLTKKIKKNEGEVEQFYVENSHPAIIDEEIFDHVQAELERVDGRRRSSQRTIFSGKIFCGECGSIFGSKVWHSTDQYRRTIWQCNAKFGRKGEGSAEQRTAATEKHIASDKNAAADKNDGTPTANKTPTANNTTVESAIQPTHKPKCTTPHLTEEKLKSCFVAAFNGLLENRAELLQTYRTILKDLTNTTELNEIKQSAQREYDEIIVLMEKAIAEGGSGDVSQRDFDNYYADLLSRADAAKARLQSTGDEILRKTKQRKKLNAFMSELENRGDLLTGFDEELFVATVEKITVYPKKLTFLFKDGSDIDTAL